MPGPLRGGRAATARLPHARAGWRALLAGRGGPGRAATCACSTPGAGNGVSGEALAARGLRPGRRARPPARGARRGAARPARALRRLPRRRPDRARAGGGRARSARRGRRRSPASARSAAATCRRRRSRPRWRCSSRRALRRVRVRRRARPRTRSGACSRAPRAGARERACTAARSPAASGCGRRRWSARVERRESSLAVGMRKRRARVAEIRLEVPQWGPCHGRCGAARSRSGSSTCP